MLKGDTITSFTAQKMVQDAMLCKIWHCTPPQLRKVPAEDVEKYSFIYAEIMKKNPLLLFS